jgi:hypothetical protein
MVIRFFSFSGQHCVFPFKYDNETFTACIDDGDIGEDGGHWCPTKLDNNGELLHDNWGYCGTGCDHGEGSEE